MSDNIRTSLYGAEYDVRLASRVSDAAPTLSRVVGKHCESGDIVVRDAWVPVTFTPVTYWRWPPPEPIAIRCRVGTT